MTGQGTPKPNPAGAPVQQEGKTPGSLREEANRVAAEKTRERAEARRAQAAQLPAQSFNMPRITRSRARSASAAISTPSSGSSTSSLKTLAQRMQSGPKTSKTQGAGTSKKDVDTPPTKQAIVVKDTTQAKPKQVVQQVPVHPPPPKTPPPEPGAGKSPSYSATSPVYAPGNSPPQDHQGSHTKQDLSAEWNTVLDMRPYITPNVMQQALGFQSPYWAWRLVLGSRLPVVSFCSQRYWLLSRPDGGSGTPTTEPTHHNPFDVAIDFLVGTKSTWLPSPMICDLPLTIEHASVIHHWPTYCISRRA